MNNKLTGKSQKGVDYVPNESNR